MENKIVVILEVVAIIIGLVVYSVLVVVPEYKEKIGSSDSFVNTNVYRNMIEIQINDQTDFAFLLNEDGKVYHLFFFDNSSVFLYNKNIENHNLEDSLTKMVQQLIASDLLKSDSKVEVYRYGEDFYQDFTSSWEKLSTRYLLPMIVEDKKSMDEKASELGLDDDSSFNVLLRMDFYSKEIIQSYDDSISKRIEG